AAASPTVVETGDIRYSTTEVLEEGGFGTEAVARLTEFLVGGEARHELERLTGIALRGDVLVNATRYHRGDFLRAHVDTYDSGVLSLLLYLHQPDWAEGDGGLLGFQGADGVRDTLPPRHNSMVLLPLRPDLAHCVTTVLRPSFVRSSLIAHYRAA
ncbi:MAG TPA: 2OG-Fe(II) oxygenase, partial [Mycobacteriales bacterium]|nr:2OG-Fe(II) oxygenase [Mycobacteriales bacterium]